MAQSLLVGTGLENLFRDVAGRPTVVVNTYEGLVQEVMRLIELGKKEIHIASRYHEPEVSKRLIEKFGKGVALNIIDGNPTGISLTARLQAASTSADPATRAIMKAVLESPRVRIARLSLDYSFIVVDRRYCGFEVVSPLSPHDFKLAVEFEEEELAQRMVDVFENLWKSGQSPAPADGSGQLATMGARSA